MEHTIIIDNLYDFTLYLNDTYNYVNSIFYYCTNHTNLDSSEILMYLSSIHEIIENLKFYLYKK